MRKEIWYKEVKSSNVLKHTYYYKRGSISLLAFKRVASIGRRLGRI